jgi:hypothetical protein
VDPLWHDVQAIQVAPAACGLLRRRLVQVREERLLQGLQGSLTSWSALRGFSEVGPAVDVAVPMLELRWAAKGRTFASEVRRKRASQMAVTAFLGRTILMRRSTGAYTALGARAW